MADRYGFRFYPPQPPNYIPLVPPGSGRGGGGGNLPPFQPPGNLPRFQPPPPSYFPPRHHPPSHFPQPHQNLLHISPPHHNLLSHPHHQHRPSRPPAQSNRPPHFPPPSTGHYPPHGGATNTHAAYYWVDTNSARGVLPTSVHGGVDIDGTQIYVGRAFHDGDWIPAKVIPEKNVAYIAYDGKEIAVHSFQVLCEQRFDWIPAFGGQVPFNAVEGGRTSDGETLYIGRVFHEGSNTVGKVHPSHGSLYIPFNGEEVAYQSYEILVLR